MSLDVYLVAPTPQKKEGSGIFVREYGRTREISREEWDALHPGRVPVTVAHDEESNDVYWANITHNLGKMADEAGIYEALWRPEELGAQRARDIIAALRGGLAALRADPERFRAFNPSNGWGDYEGLVHFVAQYLAACEQHPEAIIRVSR